MRMTFKMLSIHFLRSNSEIHHIYHEKKQISWTLEIYLAINFSICLRSDIWIKKPGWIVRRGHSTDATKSDVNWAKTVFVWEKQSDRLHNLNVLRITISFKLRWLLWNVLKLWTHENILFISSVSLPPNGYYLKHSTAPFNIPINSQGTKRRNFFCSKECVLFLLFQHWMIVLQCIYMLSAAKSNISASSDNQHADRQALNDPFSKSLMSVYSADKTTDLIGLAMHRGIHLHYFICSWSIFLIL